MHHNIHNTLCCSFQFKTVVEWIKPVIKKDKTVWEVTVRDLTNKTDVLQTSLFDAVIVCNG